MLARSLLGALAGQRLRTAAAIIAGFLGSGAIALAETDLGSVAPWQVPPEMRSGSGPATSQGMPAHVDEGDATPSPTGPCHGDCAVGDSCGSCDSCDAGPRFCRPCDSWFWLRGDYLMWWGKSAHLPAMAANDLAGVSTIFGDQGIEQGLGSGMRITLGGWLTDDHEGGIELSYLLLGGNSASFTQDTDEYPTLTRPFFSASTFAQAAVVLGNPGHQTGSLTTEFSSEVQSFEALYRRVIFHSCDEQIDGLIGYRYGRLTEKLAVNSSTTIVSDVPPFADGTVIDVNDLFNTRNEFEGGEIGISAKSRYCRWSMELLGKLALGSMQSRSIVAGSTTTTPPSPASASTTTGGVLALPTNSGTFEQTGFAVMPELGLNLGYDITPRLKATCGYTFLYFSRVVRPADQIDTNLNPTQFSGGTLSGFPTPEPRFVLSDYWAQGLTFGIDYRF
ncbi:MAG: BBP7 family outer membrane beta-barrel protein [Thermoguttaceae bacterium]